MMDMKNERKGFLPWIQTGIRLASHCLAPWPLRALCISLIALPAFTANCQTATHLLSTEARRDMQLQPAVVFIQVVYHFDLRDYELSCGDKGTGFLYRPDGYIVTNGHVVQMANRKDLSAMSALEANQKGCAKAGVDDYLRRKTNLTDDQKRDVQAKLYQLIDEDFDQVRGAFDVPTITVFLSNGKRFQGEIKAYSDPISEGGKDIAIIKIDGKDLPTVPVGDSDEVRVGDAIVVIGYPGAGETSDASTFVPTVTNGKVSALKTDEKGTPVIQSEAAINPGNSGGPAFNAAGRVIGIATYKSTEAEEINFFVPVNTAKEFIRQAGAEPTSGLFDVLWKRALDAYENQHWTEAHALMGSVLEVMPGEADAKALQQQAAANMPAESVFSRIDEWEESVSAPVLAGGVLVVVALVAAGFILLVYKPKARSAVVSSRPSGSTERPTVVDRPQALGSLQITNGPNKGKQYVIPKTGLQIGRDPQSCTIVLPADNVGREHAWVMPMENGEVAVIDRGSANHTYVNSFEDGPIKKVMLKNGDRIFICRENSTEIVYFRG